MQNLGGGDLSIINYELLMVNDGIFYLFFVC